MKHPLLFLPLGLLAAPAFGQQVEYSLHAHGTAAQFAGSTTVASTTINDANNVPTAPTSRAVNPYGSKMGFAGGLGLRAQYVAKFNVLAAFDLGYEAYNSRADVTGVTYASTVQPLGLYTSGTGIVHLYTQAATAFAGVGYRLGGGEHAASLDLLVGPELEYLTAAHELGEGSSTRGSWSTDLPRTPDNRLGFRLRGELTFWIKKVGVLGGYSYGFTNHMPISNNVAPEANLRIFRAGLAYRFNR